MESKNVKVIDEHNIDRDANIVCAFNVDSNDYVLYWIERDEENLEISVLEENLKLIKLFYLHQKKITTLQWLLELILF